jgi:cell division initiation protein
MPLKPSDIEHKTFSTALRGYDLNEVDDFLDEVIATIRDLEDKVASGKGDGSVTPAAPMPDESAVGRALIAAQNAADQILADAREEADRIKEDARGDAETWMNERDQKKAEAEQEMAELRLRVDNVRRELAVLATVVADGLDEMDSSITSGSRGISPAILDDVEVAEEGSDVLEEKSSDSSDSDGSGDDEAESPESADIVDDEEDSVDGAGSFDDTAMVDEAEDAVGEGGLKGDHEAALEEASDLEIEVDDTESTVRVD